jgi:hypothetical protein
VVIIGTLLITGFGKELQSLPNGDSVSGRRMPRGTNDWMLEQDGECVRQVPDEVLGIEK